ncbi:NACHT domain-containing protein [Kitasatospora sp. NPDC008050]|uniref:NACHT domain-containing protein n=1 Tax=Kitasatospora sp. NPDC008050 TaxID=3364021 RepID=UPI0036F082CD
MRRVMRAVAVRGGQQGSGVLLTERLVLTAGHTACGEVEVAAPRRAGGRGWVRATVLWSSAELDVALLRAAAPAADPLAPPHWAATDRLVEPLSPCHLTGFPSAARERDGRLDSLQVTATLTPGSGAVLDQHVLEVNRVPAGREPWSGMSGAGVFCRDQLLGIVLTDWRTDHAWLTFRPVSALLDIEAFREHLPFPVRLERAAVPDVADTDFERRYREWIAREHGKLRIFGLDLSRSHSRLSELDTAYLSLESTDHLDRDRVETMLRSRPRVLLRGQAGSGKSTLVQWLAVHAEQVPFVLRLRSMYHRGNLRPGPEEFLALNECWLGDQPEGWAERVLRAGRALVLVDGLDEVPETQREEARGWLGKLLTHYPDNHYLATVRPSAVPSNWLRELRFEELSLCPMVPADRIQLIERWHAAAAEESRSELDRVELPALEGRLLRFLLASPELAQLADSPLLCAMLCALNREWDGALPRRRMEVYEAALNMLLVRRDQQRGVEAAAVVPLTKEEQLAVLQRIAAWLVKNSAAEASPCDAVHQIRRLLPTLSYEAGAVSPELIFAQLVERSGLLAETSADSFEFVHRTFQDYLAALEFTEDRDFGLLAGHAAEDQWSDVIRLTVGHAGPADRGELLTRLLEAAQRARGKERSRAIRVLVATCLPYATRLPEQVRHRITESTTKLCRGGLYELYEGQVRLLAQAGDEIVPCLSLRDQGEGWQERVFGLLADIGSERSLARLADLAGQLDPAGRSKLSRLWGRCDVETFAREVLARVDLARSTVTVHSDEELASLIGVGPLGTLELKGSRSLERELLGQLSVSHLAITGDRALTGLEFLDSLPELEHLSLAGCHRLKDLSALAGRSMTSLFLHEVGGIATAEELARLLRSVPGIRRIGLYAAFFRNFRGDPLPPLEELVITVDDWVSDIVLDPGFLAAVGTVTFVFTKSPIHPIDLSPLGGERGPRIVLSRNAPDPRLDSCVAAREAVAPHRLTVAWGGLAGEDDPHRPLPHSER